MFKAFDNTKQCTFLSCVLQQLVAPVRWPCVAFQQQSWFPKSAQWSQTHTSKDGASQARLQSTHTVSPPFFSSFPVFSLFSLFFFSLFSLCSFLILLTHSLPALQDMQQHCNNAMQQLHTRREAMGKRSLQDEASPKSLCIMLAVSSVADNQPLFVSALQVDNQSWASSSGAYPTCLVWPSQCNLRAHNFAVINVRPRCTEHRKPAWRARQQLAGWCHIQSGLGCIYCCALQPACTMQYLDACYLYSLALCNS